MAQHNGLRVRKGFLTFGPVMDSLSRFRDDEEEPGTVEIHNHIPESGNEPDYGSLTSEQMDHRHRDEGPDEEEEFVEFLPADCFARETEDGRTAIYRHKNYDGRHLHTAEHHNLAFHDRRAARDQQPPKSLAELNARHRHFYAHSRAVR